jgi:UDP-3-O-[3-hydroxymyristoyl] glucosamine N-acyltransferase
VDPNDPPSAGRAGDPRFFARGEPLTIALIAAAAGAEPSFNDGRLIGGVGPVQSAGPAELSFVDNRRYAQHLAATRAGAVLVHPDLAPAVPAGTIALVTKDPYRGWAQAAALFHPYPRAVPGVHPSACVDAAAVVAVSAEVGPFAVIGADARIGDGCVIGAHAVIGGGVVIGEECRIGARRAGRPGRVRLCRQLAAVPDRAAIRPGDCGR